MRGDLEAEFGFNSRAQLKEKLQERNDNEDTSDDSTLEVAEEEVDNFKPDIKELAGIKHRLDDLEAIQLNRLPIPPLTPGSTLEDVKRVLNQIVNYINVGVRNG